MDVPQELAEQLARGNCVAFVGAGLSRAAGLLTWTDLLKKLLDKAEGQGVLRDERPELEDLLKAHEYLLAAAELRELLGKPNFQKCVAEMFGGPGLKPAPVHQTLTALPFSALLTSNYDKLLESAFAIANSGEAAPSFTYTDTGEMARRIGASRVLTTGPESPLRVWALGRSA